MLRAARIASLHLLRSTSEIRTYNWIKSFSGKRKKTTRIHNNMPCAHFFFRLLVLISSSECQDHVSHFIHKYYYTARVACRSTKHFKYMRLACIKSYSLAFHIWFFSKIVQSLSSSSSSSHFTLFLLLRVPQFINVTPDLSPAITRSHKRNAHTSLFVTCSALHRRQ